MHSVIFPGRFQPNCTILYPNWPHLFYIINNTRSITCASEFGQSQKYDPFVKNSTFNAEPQLTILVVMVKQGFKWRHLHQNRDMFSFCYLWIGMFVIFLDFWQLLEHLPVMEKRLCTLCLCACAVFFSGWFRPNSQFYPKIGYIYLNVWTVLVI